MLWVSSAEVRNAARSLARTPTVTLSAVVCMALGTGATTAMYSAVSRALLQPLPVRDGTRLVAVHRTTPQSGPQGTWPQSAPNYLDLARRTRLVQGLAAISQETALVRLSDNAVQVPQLYITGNLFATLGVTAERGRLIGPDDDRLDRPLVAVFADEFWRDRLGADPATVGRTFVIDGQPTTIIGIAPPDLRIPHGGNVLRADVWMPIRFTPSQLSQRRSNYLQLLGRLAPGATLQSAGAELGGLFTNLVAAYPALRGENLRVAPLQAESLESVRTPLLLLFGAVCIVLSIAATNVAALLLARGVQRRREGAVRSALGASRWDMMRIPLLESCLIAGLGGALGIAIAAAGVRTIGVLAASRMQPLVGLGLDTRVLAFALIITLVVAFACGAVPAWRGASVDPQDALRGGRGGGAGRDHHRALRALVALEIALSLVLMISAGLVLKGLAGLLRYDPGFETAHVVTMRVITPTAQAPVREFLEPGLAAIRAVPGVEAAGAISAVPYLVWGNNSNIRYQGRPAADPTRLPIVEQRTVTPEFFVVTKQRLVSGRLIRPGDGEASQSPVVVVNQALAKRDFPGLDPVGQRFYTSDTSFATIVGVVSDIRNAGPIREPEPEMYWPYNRSFRLTSPAASGFPIMIRVAAGNPTAIVPTVRAALQNVDRSAVIADVSPMRDVIARSLGRPRFYFSLLAVFAAIAMLLAVSGLYGLLSYAVAQRTREIGIRAALGCSRGAIIRLIGLQGARLVAVGLVVGLAAGAAITRVIAFMLYGVSPLDISTWLAAVMLLIGAAVLATIVPAYRAARVEPSIAMQVE
jgi:predicted permease